MSMVFYEAGSLTIGVNADEVAEKLGELRNKTPAVIKVAANYTARETRKEMLRGLIRPDSMGGQNWNGSILWASTTGSITLWTTVW